MKIITPGKIVPFKCCLPSLNTTGRRILTQVRGAHLQNIIRKVKYLIITKPLMLLRVFYGEDIQNSFKYNLKGKVQE